MISIIKRSKPLIRQYRYWIFALGMGIILIMLEDLDIEPVFSIVAFMYWSLLFFWGAQWIFGQTKTILKQQKEKTNIELLHLQSQVSPHFFFNTLNNLYGLVEKDAKKAQKLILKLSDMMRYSIYDGQKEAVTLEEELIFINNYIELHTARYHKKTQIQVSKHIQKEGMKVKPLLFIILVENAFKHGVENLRENAFVHIHLTANENEIIFAVENNFEDTESGEIQGIGLKNLQRRLELVYPKKHSLSHSVANNIYRAQLTLKLT
jgi:two-component system, LytTR family, sensor histidine kinase AlgZ